MDERQFFDRFNYYRNRLCDALGEIDQEQLLKARSMIIEAHRNNLIIYSMGNGGSAAIAEHLSCDHGKGIRSTTNFNKAETVCLASNMSMITAIGNDFGFENIFHEQIQCIKKGLIIAISSSGSSPNIVKGLRTARHLGFPTIAMVGFDGGTVLRDELADAIIHVPVHNYGIVEDAHQIIMHTLAQDISLAHSYNRG